MKHEYRAWIKDYETDEYYMYEWHKDLFSDMSPVTRYGSEFPDPDDPDIILMQYVGMKDMNGKEIYEGDIIRKEMCDYDDPAYGHYGAIGVVKYYEEVMGFIIDAIDEGETAFYDNMGTNFSWYEIEVIGNIHENPDLIE